MVALIARAHLTPAVSAAVDVLLKAGPIDPALNRFCKDRPDDLLADAATWADDAKNGEKTSVWHYVDIPRTVTAVTSLDPWCPDIGPSVDGKNRPGCITKAIDYELAILKDGTKPAKDRATALRYIVHFLGDLHQPLHDSDNNDQGGNCTSMQFFGGDKPVNLHSIWDYLLIEHQMEISKLSQPAYAAALDAKFAGRAASVMSAKIDPVAWAWETHAISESVTYGLLSPQIPKEDPAAGTACQAERDKVQALKIAIGDAYFSKSIPVIEEQIAVAGYRLAAVLNATIR